LSVALLVTIVAGACAPPRPAGPDSGAPQGQPQGARKTFSVAVIQEPPHIEGFTGAAGSGGAGAVKNVVHNYLAYEDDQVNFKPQLAAELPAVDRGTWLLNPDGSMDVTWRVRPNVRWHDGAPFTSADMLFSFGVYKDPDLPTAAASTLRLMSSAMAPDPHTLVVHWSRTYVRANEPAGLTPLPRHLLEDLYRTDKDAFVSSSHFTSGFVGLGPYRLAKWEFGSHMELTRFDDYFLGRPPFDNVYVRFVLDANTMVANILSGAVDAVLPPSVDLSAAFELKRRWEGTGHQVRVDSTGRMHFMEIQYRPEYARPRNGLSNATVRRALYQATDRQALNEVIAEGLAPLADSYVRPTDPWRRDVESAIPQYPYDPARAQQLLAQAGWVRGPDGALVHNQTGDRFEGEVWARQAAGGIEREPTIVADQWNSLGTKLTPYVVPAAREDDREYQALLPTIIISGNLGPDSWYTDRLHSQFIASAENRWSGRNKLGYTNPRADTLIDQLQVAIDPGKRAAAHRQLLQEVIGDLAFFPLYWEVVPILLLKGVRPSPDGVRNLANFVGWDRE